MSADDIAPDLQPTEGVEIDKATDNEEDSAAVDTSADETSGVDEGTRNSDKRPLGAIPVTPVVLALALALAGVLTGWLYFTQYRPDVETDDAVAQSVVNAARDGTVALLSYKPDSLEKDFAAAKSHLTGEFLNYYEQFTKQVVTPAAQSKAVMTAAQVVGAAASELHPDSAVVLVFVNQVTTSKERPDPSMAASSVKVSLTKQHGAWLINKFDPL